MSYFALLSACALALADKNITLNVFSQDRSINGSGIQNIHFGAGFNGALISPELVTYDLNSTTSEVYQEIEIADGPIPFVLGELFNTLYAEAGGSEIPAKVDSCGFLTVNGSSSVFYACDKLPYDYYGYVSAAHKGVAVYGKTDDIPDYCFPIRIKATDTQ